MLHVIDLGKGCCPGVTALALPNPGAGLVTRPTVKLVASTRFPHVSPHGRCVAQACANRARPRQSRRARYLRFRRRSRPRSAFSETVRLRTHAR